MNLILLLGFLLAFLPGQNVHRLHVDQTPDFVALIDQIQAIPLNEKSNKKFEVQNEDLFLPTLTVSIKIDKCPAPSIVAILSSGQPFTVPYAIRGPPTTV